MKHIYVIALIFVMCFSSASAQLGFSHEIGAIAGPVAFQSDYGVSKNFDTFKGNTGYVIGLVHYINFAYRADCNCFTKDTYFNDHFKIRNELSYSYTSLEHFGPWVNPNKTSLQANALRGMRGETGVTSLGSMIEYFPMSIRQFVGGSHFFAPYIALGANFNSFNVNYMKNDDALKLQDLVDSDNQFLYDERSNIYRSESVKNEEFSTWSINWSLGTRYKFTPLSDFLFEVRWVYYFTDWGDGLNHNGPSDKNYDWNFWATFGYVYYLD